MRAMPDEITVAGSALPGGVLHLRLFPPPSRWQRFRAWLSRWAGRLIRAALLIVVGYAMGEWL